MIKSLFDQYHYDPKHYIEALPGHWVGMDTLKRWLSHKVDAVPVAGTCDAGDDTQSGIILTVGTWVTQLVTVSEPPIAARRKDSANVIDAKTAYDITQHCKIVHIRRYLGVSPGGSVYYTNGHYLLRQGAADPGIAGSKCLDFGGKRTKKGQGLPAVYTGATMPDCERVWPKLDNLQSPKSIKAGEIDRLYAWYKAQGNKRFNTLSPNGLYTNFEAGDAHFDIVFQGGYNLEYLKAVSDWVGDGALWREAKPLTAPLGIHLKAGDIAGPMVVESTDGTRFGVIMPVRV